MNRLATCVADWAKDNDPALVSADNNFGPILVAKLNQWAPVSLSPAGFTGGGQIGYNWQISSIVVGVEGDFEGMTGSATRTLNTILGPNPTQFIDSAKVRWMSTLRGRLGFATDRFLIYGTGGAAWSEWETTHSFAYATVAAGGTFGAVDWTFTRSGWTAGGGLEYALLNNWTLRAEYLYADFGTRTDTLVTAVPLFPGGGFVTNFSHPEKLTVSVARAGLNYKF